MSGPAAAAAADPADAVPAATGPRLAAAEVPFESERLRFEPLHRGHAAELFSGLADARLYLFVPQEPPASLEWLAWRYGLLESRQSPAGDQLWLNWALRLTQSAACIGTVQVTVRADSSAYLAYELCTDAWGRGLATEACGRVLAVLAADFGVRRVEAEVDTRNAASIRLLERLGFSRRGLKRDADFFKGATSDEYTYERMLPPVGPGAAPG